MDKLSIICISLLIFSCKKVVEATDTGHSSLESIVNTRCIDSYDQKGLTAKLIGLWKLVAEGCYAFCSTTGVHDTKRNVELLFQSDTALVYFQDNIAKDTVVFRVSQDAYSKSFKLEPKTVKTIFLIIGCLFFCKDTLWFDNNGCGSADGGVYLFKQ